MALTKVTEKIISDNLSISGIATATNFKTGTTNVHNVGVEAAGINVLGGNTPIGTGATIFSDGSARFGHTGNNNTGIVTANKFIGDGSQLTGIDATSIKHTDGNVKVQAINTGANLTGNLSVSGNLGVGGVLTYEDVTNVDSVGVITARSGIKIGPTAGVAGTFFADGSYVTAGIITAATFHGSGANLTALNGSNIASGTVAAARIDNLAASKITSGTVATARLGSGTANNSSFLRGDQTWAAVTSTTINNNADNRLITGSGTANTLEGEANLTYDGTNLSIPEGLIHTGDTNTKIHFGTDTIKFDTAGTQRLRIYDDGAAVFGSTSKSGTVGAGGLDIQGNSTNCILEMGNPFPGFSGGVVPEFRITATNSSHEVKFESVWGGDNGLHPHLAFTGGRTHFYKGTNSDEIARFDSDKFGINESSPQRLLSVSKSSTASYNKSAEGAADNHILRIHNPHGTDNSGVNNHTGLEFIVSSGANSIGQVGLVRTGNNTGDMFFKQRTGASTYRETFRVKADNTTYLGGYLGTGAPNTTIVNENVIINCSSADNYDNRHTVSFGQLDGNWTGSGSDSSWGLMWHYAPSDTAARQCRAGIVFDHSNTEEFKIWSSYGDIVFNGHSSNAGNLTAEQCNMELARFDGNGHFIPGVNNGRDLGSSAKKWRNIYVMDMHFSNEGGSPNSVDGTTGNWTLQEGADGIYMINNKNGKKYEMMLKEVQ